MVQLLERPCGCAPFKLCCMLRDTLGTRIERATGMLVGAHCKSATMPAMYATTRRFLDILAPGNCLKCMARVSCVNGEVLTFHQ
jgi:hypothetical protein